MAAALGAFGRFPDLVVSGINAGPNTGHSIIHSGTVGAALTARTFLTRGIAHQPGSVRSMAVGHRRGGRCLRRTVGNRA